MPTTKELQIEEIIAGNPYYFGKLMSKCAAQVLQMGTEINEIAALEPTGAQECVDLWAENN